MHISTTIMTVITMDT